MKTSPSPSQSRSKAAPPMMDTTQLTKHLEQARPVLVVSPPRSVSTAFSRALSQHSQIQRYFHEPCGRYSYENTSLETVLDELEGLAPGALIKEMTFQMPDLSLAECFFRHCSSPIIFLARSPILTIESRIRMVLTDLIQSPSTSETKRGLAQNAIDTTNYSEVNDLVTEEIFPLYRTGWTHFAEHLGLCRNLDIDYLIVRASRFRSSPEETLKKLCHRLGLPFEENMLSWPARKASIPGALNRHANWYARVNASTTILPPNEKALPVDRFPSRFQEHLREALKTYEDLISDAKCL